MKQTIGSVLVAAGLFFPATVGIGTQVAALGCTPAEQREAKVVTQDVLGAGQIACIIASAFVSAPEVIAACQIDERLSPIVDQLLAQKRMAMRAAACAPADAGK